MQTVADIDLQRGLVDRAARQGRQGPRCPVRRPDGTTIDRYLRARRTHRLADTGPLWVGAGGKTFGYYGLNTHLKERAEAAGIKGFHLHLLRHTAATRWLRAGGSEQGLMAVAGWSTRGMIDRYTGASVRTRCSRGAQPGIG